MRALMLVQQIEENHWLRGFIVSWVRELAARVERLHVITLEQGTADLPENVSVHSMGKERGYNRLRELREFHRAISRVIGDVDVIFSHMTPRYTWVAAPYAALYRKRQVLWYTHPHASPELRLATALSWRVVTAVEGSFPLKTPKLRVLGHGIDADFFSPGDGQEAARPDRRAILLVGRLMPAKNHATLLRALAAIAADLDVQAVLIGAVPQEQDQAYADQLKALATNLKLTDRVVFTGALPPREVRDWYRRAAVAVNLTGAGFFDKAALESMAVRTPTVVCNPLFDALLGEYTPQLRIAPPDDVDGLAARLRALICQSSEERARMTAAIRERVTAAHSLKRLVMRLVSVLETGEIDGS